MSDPAPPPLEYQTPTPKERWLLRFCGALALICAVAQFPWLLVAMFLQVAFRLGRQIDLAIDIPCEIFYVLPSLFALMLGFLAMTRARKSTAQFMLGLMAIVVVGVFLPRQVSGWWNDIGTDGPGGSWPSL